ncbi:MarR family transcriptional regulator [Oerskovia sp. M15]
MTQPPTTAREDLVREFLTTQQALGDLILARRLEPLLRTRLTVQQMRALAILLIDGERSTTHLGEVLGVSAATVSGIVDRLVAAEMASRRPDPEDGRVRLVTATERGAEAVRGIVANDDPTDLGTLEKLTLEEMQALTAGLNGLLRVVQEESTDLGEE